MSASELAGAARDALASLAAGDRSLRRFGAAAHRYELLPPLTEDELAAVEERLGPLPADLRAFVRDAGRGGAGPGYGWLPIDRVPAYTLPGCQTAVTDSRDMDPPTPATAGGRGSSALAPGTAIPLADLGCGQIAALALADGRVWIDARGAGACAPIYDSFTAFYVDWLMRLARNDWPAAHVPAGSCALPAALGGYFAACEQRLGLAAGTLAGDPLREALADLGPSAIAIAADGPPELFAPEDRADPCIACARLVANLAADGLSPTAIAPGVRPRLRSTGS